MFDITAARFTSRTIRKNMVIFVEDKLSLTEDSQQVNDLMGGKLLKALKSTGFKGGNGSVEALYGLDVEGVETVIAIGVGKLNKMTQAEWAKLGIELGNKLVGSGLKDLSIVLGANTGAVEPVQAAEGFLEGLHLGFYRFDQFKKTKTPKCSIKKITVFTDGRSSRLLADRLPDIQALVEAQAHARTLVNLPPNVANPEYMAQEARNLKEYGVKVKVLEEAELTKLGMGLMMAVGGGARKEDQPRLVIMTYEGAGKDEPYRAIVGKGVMFDTGGYNLKPSASIAGMKADMGGSAAVLGAMEVIAKRKMPINVVAVCGCVMNMISGDAFLPDAIITGYNGTTAEIGNTDAEGRMVLGDAIAYTIDKYKPVELIDLATLTGACMVALGGIYAGCFSNNDRLANSILKSADITGESAWRLPIGPGYYPSSTVADLHNAGSGYGGASGAAMFINKFVGNTPWVHLDIAGVGMAGKQGMKGYRKLGGGTGFGVHLLAHYFESEAAKLQEKNAGKKTKKRSRRRS